MRVSITVVAKNDTLLNIETRTATARPLRNGAIFLMALSPIHFRATVFHKTPHSYRSATIGLTRLARYAGM
jgi:hypothetical protein